MGAPGGLAGNSLAVAVGRQVPPLGRSGTFNVQFPVPKDKEIQIHVVAGLSIMA